MIKYIYGILLGICLVTVSCKESYNSISYQKYLKNTEIPQTWKAKWIGLDVKNDTVNTWAVFRKEIEINTISGKPFFAKIAVDSKYWLWINNQMVVYEGGLKRGPTPKDTYYDNVDITKYLKKGKNTIAVLVWYFGKNGFSHNNSGKLGFIFDMQSPDLEILTDDTWKAWLHPAYGESKPPYPNYRLPESNVFFDARKGNFDFTTFNFDDNNKPNAILIGDVGIAPYNNLKYRQIPQWKDSGLKNYETKTKFPFISNGDTIALKLPYNAHVTPYFEIEANPDQYISILTDNYKGGSAYNVRADYITRSGEQSYESFGWMNGEKVLYCIPRGIKVIDLKYRETGYNTNFDGSFECDVSFYNQLWEKSLRTLYVTMRDTYMDCPDRERAQWWGDVVLESGEAFYALSPSSHLLTKKGMLELINWQRSDGTLFSPVPAGNWNSELPTQMLSSIGTFGFWNYYWHTNDKETIAKVYKGVEDYLAVWKLKPDGTLEIRNGGWIWGDWGDNKDIPLLFNTQYYMALESYLKMSELLGKEDNAKRTKFEMEAFKVAFNNVFWNGNAYKSKNYFEKTDDRSQGLAVVAGLADSDKYEAILKILKEEKHASPYMEKYVLEALFKMGFEDDALKRMQERFGEMVNSPNYSTLWEGWGIGAKGFGGGTTNHAWSGGGLTLLSQYVAGIYPTSAGYDTFQVKPQLGFLKHIKAIVPSIKGPIEIEITKTDAFKIELKVPEKTKAQVYIPKQYKKVKINGKYQIINDAYFVLKPGSYKINAFN